MKLPTPYQNQSRAIPGSILPVEDLEVAVHNEAIARKAYFNYVDHGSQPGHDVRDWLEAEAAVHNEHKASIANGGLFNAPFDL